MKKKIRIVNMFAAMMLTMMFYPGYAGDANFSTIVSANALARDGLFFANTDGLSAGMINPAALVHLEARGFEISILDRNSQQEFYQPVQGLHRSFRRNDFSFAGGAYWRILPAMAIAFSAYSEIDYQVEWPFALLRKKNTTVSVLGFDVYHRLRVDAVAPGLAFKIGNLSGGFALPFYRFFNQLSFPVENEQWYLRDLGLAAYPVEYKLDAWSYGFQLGIMAQMTKKLCWGLSLRSSVKAELTGFAKTQMFIDSTLSPIKEVDLNTDWELPWQIGTGLNYQLSDKWEVNSDVLIHLWKNTQEALKFKFNNSDWTNKFSKLDSAAGIRGTLLPLNFNHQLEIGIGLVYHPNVHCGYLFGYRFSQSPNSESTYHLLFPAVSQHWLSAGLSHIAQNYQVNFAIAYGFGMKTKVNNPQNQWTSGNYDGYTLVPMLTFQYHL